MLRSARWLCLAIIFYHVLDIKLVDQQGLGAVEECVGGEALVCALVEHLNLSVEIVAVGTDSLQTYDGLRAVDPFTALETWILNQWTS